MNNGHLLQPNLVEKRTLAARAALQHVTSYLWVREPNTIAAQPSSKSSS